MEKDKAYYFRFSPQKWLSAVSKVQLLNHEEKGIYWDLCCMIFCENGKINYDDLLCRKMRIEKAKLTNCLNLLLNLNLLVLDNGFLYSKYMSEELEIIKDMSQKRRVSGAAGGRPKKQTKASLSDKDNDKDNDKDKKEDIKEKNSNTSQFHPYPKTALQVQEEANKIGYAMTDEEAQKFISHYESTGWTLGNGQVISNWKKRLSIWRTYQHNHKSLGNFKTEKPEAEKDYSL